MRIASVNIEGSKHLDRVSRFLDAHDPDVVCVQELFERDMVLLERYPHVSFAPMVTHDGARKGIGFASKRPHEPIEHRYAGPESLHEYVKFDEAIMQRWLLGGVIDGISIIGTHMMVTADASIEDFQYRDARAVIEFLADRERVLLCGDFNAPRGGPIFNLLDHAFEDTIPHDATTTLDNDLHRAAPLHLVVDGAFTRGVRVRTDLIFGVSDHAALAIETLE